jgi:hypothetical protein
MRHTILLLAATTLTACNTAQTPATEMPATTLPIFGDGYPNPGDTCRRVGESAETNNFLDDSADLIGCPEDWSERENFAQGLGAREVLRQDGWVLYSVPRGL